MVRTGTTISSFLRWTGLLRWCHSAEWEARLQAVDDRFQSAKVEWAAGRRVPLFDPADAIAWYCYQARRYADPSLRADFFLPEGYRIAPLFRRIGQILPSLLSVNGVVDRAARLLTETIAQPDDGIFELLVAGAYAIRGWDEVAFVPETPGKGKQPDLLVHRPRRHWAVECKRAGRSGYASDERAAGERMAQEVHRLARTSGRSLIVVVEFTDELPKLDPNYLVDKAERFLDGRDFYEWSDEAGNGAVFDANWSPLHAVLEQDDIYFGSSRMVELLLGQYNPRIDFSAAGDWTPGDGRPLHATWIDQLSLVVWTSRSAEAARRKASHFRSLVAGASRQLPGDRPGAIHVGYEAVGGNSADGLRHFLNQTQLRTFDPGESRLRIVYGNYFRPELVTARNESSAVDETMAWYPVGSAKALQPLPRHLLFRDGEGATGWHLDC